MNSIAKRIVKARTLVPQLLATIEVRLTDDACPAELDPDTVKRRQTPLWAMDPRLVAEPTLRNLARIQPHAGECVSPTAALFTLGNASVSDDGDFLYISQHLPPYSLLCRLLAHCMAMRTELLESGCMSDKQWDLFANMMYSLSNLYLLHAQEISPRQIMHWVDAARLISPGCPTVVIDDFRMLPGCRTGSLAALERAERDLADWAADAPCRILLVTPKVVFEKCH